METIVARQPSSTDGQHFRVHGELTVKTVASMIFTAAHVMRSREPLWIELADTIRFAPGGLEALASWVLAVRGHTVFVIGLKLIEGDTGPSPRPLAFG